MGSPSLVILVTRSFTTPVHTTGTIPIAIILAITLMVTDTAALAIILMVTDTVALPAAAFVAAAFVAVAFVAVDFAAVAFAAVGDRTIWIRWLTINTPKLVIWQSYIPEGGLLSRARRGEVDPSVVFSKTGE